MSQPADTSEFTSEGHGGPYLATFEFTRNLIAACPTFREQIIGTNSEDEAKDKIYYQETLAEENDEEEPEREGDPHPEMEQRPYCVILDDQRSRKRAGTSTWVGEGSVLAIFEVPVPSEYLPDHDEDNAEVKRDKFRRLRRWGITLASNLEKEITELSGESDAEENPFLNVTDVELIVPPADPAETLADKPFVGFAFRLRWK